MKKLLLLFALVLGTVACENLEDELNDANAEIAQLEAQIDGLSEELQNSISLNNSQAQQLAELENTIASLNSDLETAYGANIFLGNEIGELTAQLSALNEEIATLQADLSAALDNSADEATIQSLVDQIAALEAIEPEIIIEYITEIETVIVTETVTEYVATQYDAETVTIEELREELARLQAIVDEAVATTTTTEIVVENKDPLFEGTYTPGVDVNNDGDFLDTYYEAVTYEVTYDYDGNEISRVFVSSEFIVAEDVTEVDPNVWTETDGVYTKGLWVITHLSGNFYKIERDGEQLRSAYPDSIENIQSIVDVIIANPVEELGGFTVESAHTVEAAWKTAALPGVIIAKISDNTILKTFTDNGDTFLANNEFLDTTGSSKLYYALFLELR